MNKRILELAKKAGFETAGSLFGTEVPEYALPLEKFAELIVRECCEVAHCNFHVDGLTLGTILREHFGVE